MRIIGGRSRGTPIAVPPGRDVRPTRDAVREALFSILGPGVEGAAVLDLYAGSGSLGLEALSRAAASVTFVETSPAALRCIGENLAAAGLADGAEVVRADVLEFLREAASGARKGGFDLVLADPPFAFSNSPGIRRLADALRAEGLWAGVPAVAVVEVEAKNARLGDLERLPGTFEARTYGRNLLCFGWMPDRSAWAAVR